MRILIPSMNSGIYTPKLVRELIYKSGCAHDHSHDALHVLHNKSSQFTVVEHGHPLSWNTILYHHDDCVTN